MYKLHDCFGRFRDQLKRGIMGYFSNGAEGCAYESKYCENCIHWVAPEGEEHKGCPVWDIHILFAYGQSEQQKAIMDMLILNRKKLYNEQCTMFIQIKSEGQISL